MTLFICSNDSFWDIALHQHGLLCTWKLLILICIPQGQRNSSGQYINPQTALLQAVTIFPPWHLENILTAKFAPDHTKIIEELGCNAAGSSFFFFFLIAQLQQQDTQF